MPNLNFQAAQSQVSGFRAIYIKSIEHFYVYLVDLPDNNNPFSWMKMSEIQHFLANYLSQLPPRHNPTVDELQ